MVVVIADVLLLLSLVPVEAPGFDARSWWSIDLHDLNGQPRTSMVGSGAFRFSPVIAQVFAPFAALPWIVFLLVFLAIQLTAIVGMSGRRWPYVVLPPVIANLYSGNVDV